MELSLELATPGDAVELVNLHLTVNADLTARFGRGNWSVGLSEKGVLFAMKTSRVYVAKHRETIVATLTLSTKKPWAIDRTFFSDSRRPLYLTAMAVHPDHQRKGAGTQCIREARRIAERWPGDAIRLDAYDADAGAGEFYRKCDFREVGRATYRNTRLIYFEMLLLAQGQHRIDAGSTASR